jgi:hypothetical protein
VPRQNCVQSQIIDVGIARRHSTGDASRHHDGCLVILAHERRRVVHVAVTDLPTAAWTAQQLREAFPWNEAPRYLLHDRDSAFHAWTTTAAAIGIEEILTAPRAPWQKDYAPYCTSLV